MGTPDDPEGFVQFETDGLTVYVARELLEKLEPGTQQVPFYIDGYGRYALVLAEPWNGGEV
jgi:hypothetical protein